MKIYFHLNVGGFSNTYVVVNEKTREAIIIDPGKLTETIIQQIEDNHLNLVGILITHNHGSHVHGLKTLLKIYSPKIYGADWEIAGLNVKYMNLPGHTSDSMIYHIGNAIFTGDTISAGKIGSTNSSYSKHLLQHNIQQKIISQQENIVLFPGHGPPTTVGAEKKFNKDFTKEYL